MVRKVAFSALVLGVAGQRLWEVRKSRKHERALKARGAREAAPEQMPVMKAVHGAWLASMLAETWLTDRKVPAGVTTAALVTFAGGQVLRALAMRELGDRWTVKIMVLPETPPVSGGIFEHVRHPNYLGVILEMAALPLIQGNWVTALTFSIANGLLLQQRIRAEEEALQSVSDYQAELGATPRFVPMARAER